VPPERKSKPRSPEHGALGDAIRASRERLGYSQEELASRADIHITQIGGIERGVRNPSYATLVRLSRALQMAPGALLGLADEILKDAAKRPGKASQDTRAQ
jgi:transcriptional regulator with XRE-family HTH domain